LSPGSTADDGRVKVAQLMAGAAKGGAEAFFERLSLSLASSGEEVLAAIRDEPARAARLASGGVAVRRFFYGPPYDFWTRPLLGRALSGFGARVAVAWMSRAAQHAPRGDWTLVGRLGGYYDLKSFRRCDHLVANTRELAGWIAQQGWPNERVHVVPNFVADHVSAAPAEWPLPGRRVFAMGRLHANKGFDLLIRALAAVPGASLALAGDGPEEAALRALAQQAGVADRVAFLGWREGVGTWLAACEVFVLPSRIEPLGNVVLEAMGAARPILATRCAGPVENLVHGESGWLVPVEDAAALAGGLRALLADAALAARLAAAARTRFAAEHAEAPVLARWRGFLRDVAPR
jgi:glycosyltransferase involved in cell wall biosynthesis